MGSLLNLGGNTSTPTTQPVSNPNVIVPAGVDPYYGITISTLPGVSLSGGEDDTSTNTSNSSASSLLRSAPTQRTNVIDAYKNPNGKFDVKSLQRMFADYGEENPGWWEGSFGADASQDGGLGSTISPFAGTQSYPTGSYRPSTSSTAAPTVSGGGMRIAKPNMSWINNMPSVMPPGGEALLAMYGPAAFSLGANTPQVPTTPRGLTYNNPYNTNPYLPLANPFALIANSPPSGS